MGFYYDIQVGISYHSLPPLPHFIPKQLKPLTQLLAMLIFLPPLLAGAFTLLGFITIFIAQLVVTIAIITKVISTIALIAITIAIATALFIT